MTHLTKDQRSLQIHAIVRKTLLCIFASIMFIMAGCATISPEEQAQWKQATAKPFSISKVRDYIHTHPDGPYADHAARILKDEKKIAELAKDGIPESLIVPKELWPPVIKKSIAENQMRGRTVLEEVRGGAVSAKSVFGTIVMGLPKTIRGISGGVEFAGPYLPCGSRSVFIIKGQVSNIYGVPRNPIRLVYLKHGIDVKNDTIALLGGNGNIRNEDGQVVLSFPK